MREVTGGLLLFALGASWVYCLWQISTSGPSLRELCNNEGYYYEDGQCRTDVLIISREELEDDYVN